MFRLIKLAAYVVLGYIIYEMWQGMSEGQSGGQRSSGGSRQEFGSETARPGMTGGGGGMMADVADVTGSQSRRPVGRGVL